MGKISSKSQKSTNHKDKYNKYNYIKINNLYVSLDNIKEMRKQTISWGKIFATHITDERVVSRTYKELWLMSKKITNLMEKNG